MQRVAVYTNADYDREPVLDFPRADAALMIDALAGRSIGAYVLREAERNRRRKGRATAYVATNREGRWQQDGNTAGFCIRIS